MTLPVREKLAMLVPPSLFYPVPCGGTAVDVGANRGFFSYALAAIADRVIAFEPNPDYAFFVRWMSRGRAEVHQRALSDSSGRGTLYVPISDNGMVHHFAGNLRRAHSQFRNMQTFDVEMRALDEFGLMGVRFIKADVEGSEREVLDGARATIARDRPIILLGLLSGTHADPAACAAAICEGFGYDAFIVQHSEIPALPTIAALGKNTSWGTEIESRNVLFVPQ
jgi:FkbM family methyltransferase